MSHDPGVHGQSCPDGEATTGVHHGLLGLLVAAALCLAPASPVRADEAAASGLDTSGPERPAPGERLADMEDQGNSENTGPAGKAAAGSAAPSGPEPMTIDDAVRGQQVSADEADYMNELFDGYVGLRIHPPASQDENTGLMVVLHGWGGDYTQYDTSCGPWADMYNVITLQVNYRDSGDASPIYDFGKYQAVDVLRAMDYVLSTYPVNTRRIIGWGASGGGDVILQVAKMAPRTFACIVELAGITRPTDSTDTDQGYTTDPDGGWETVALGAGKSYTVPEYQLRNPQHDPELFNAPITILHGDADDVVSVQHAHDLTSALLQAGKDVSLHIVAGGSHGFGGATDPTENNRYKATNKYASEAITTLETDGYTDFERRTVVALPTDQGTYLVDYDLDGEISLRYTYETAMESTTWGRIKAKLAE